jgi:hypothetical protein
MANLGYGLFKTVILPFIRRNSELINERAYISGVCPGWNGRFPLDHPGCLL